MPISLPKFTAAALTLILWTGVACADQLHVPSQYPTIQAAIDAAMPGDVVTIAPGTYRGHLDTLGRAITLRSTDPSDPAVVAMTVLSGDTDFDGTGDTRILSAISGETLATTLDGLTLTLGRDEFGPALLADQSSITIRRCNVIANESTNSDTGVLGGAVATVSGAIVAEDCMFDNNLAFRYPRDLYASSGAITATGCEFRNTSPVPGGGSYAIRATLGGTLSVQDCTFVGLDGAILAQSIDECTIDACTFNNNSTSTVVVWATVIHMTGSTLQNCGPQETEYASESAAIQFGSASDLLIENCAFIDNTFNNIEGVLQASGGIIRDCVFARNTNEWYASCGLVAGMTIERCLFEDNAAQTVAGIEIFQGINTIRDCVFRRNFSNRMGALFVNQTNRIYIEDCEFTSNRVESVDTALATGGGLSFISRARPRGYLRRSTFIANHSSDDGGAIFFPQSSDFIIDACIFLGNTAMNQGGAIRVEDAGNRLDLMNSLFVENAAEGSGGAIYSRGQQSYVNNTFINNVAPVAPTHRHTGSNTTFVNNLIYADDLSVPQLDYSGSSTGSIVSHSIIPGSYSGPGTSTAVTDITPVLTRLPSDGGDGWGDDPATPGVDESLNDDLGDLTPISTQAIDAGSNAAAPLDRYDFDNDGDTTEPISTDGLGNDRFVDIAAVPDTGLGMAPIVDIGAVEVQSMPCPADTNHDGALTPADFTAWIAAFNAMAPACDQNADGLCNPADFTAWIANYNAGC